MRAARDRRPQDGHLDIHTAPELCSWSSSFRRQPIDCIRVIKKIFLKSQRTEARKQVNKLQNRFNKQNNSSNNNNSDDNNNNTKKGQGGWWWWGNVKT